MPESQTHAPVRSKLVILQCGCTQSSFHQNRWSVAIPEQASRQLWLRKRPGCKKCQAPVGPQPHLSSQEKVILVVIITVFAKGKSCCNAPSSSLDRCSRLCRRWKPQFSCASLPYVFSLQGAAMLFELSSALTYFYKKTSGRKNSRLKSQLPSNCLKIFYHSWKLTTHSLRYLLVNTVYKLWE